jgi:hypothetical protein
MRTSRARRAVVLSSLLVLSGLAVPIVSSAHSPECGRLIGSGLVVGYPDNDFDYLADNAVAYADANSNFASEQYALFSTHDPWGATVTETAIDAEHSYTEFAAGDLTNFPFSGYRVVVLNWDDTEIADFSTPYGGVINNLENYIEHGGVVWMQAAIQPGVTNSVAMPFGGTEDWTYSSTNAVVEPGHLLVAGASNPLTGDYASHAHFTDLPGGAHVLTREGDASGPPTLYTLRACVEGTYQADGRIRKGGGAYVGNNIYNDDGSGQARSGSAARGNTIKFSISIQNDGEFADRFELHATGSASSMYTVTYWRGTTNITSAVVAGTYRTASLAPGDSTVIKAKVKVKASATNGSSVTRLVTISSRAEPRRLDAVRFTGARS